jgi:hypothetical protein
MIMDRFTQGPETAFTPLHRRVRGNWVEFKCFKPLAHDYASEDIQEEERVGIKRIMEEERYDTEEEGMK